MSAALPEKTVRCNALTVAAGRAASVPRKDVFLAPDMWKGYVPLSR